MPETIMVPFSHLVLRHREIGIHRGRQWGFRDVFGFVTLRDVPFVTLAILVKAAYEEIAVPAHYGWPAQRAALKWLVEKGRDGIYALDEDGILVMDGRSAALRIKPVEAGNIQRVGTVLDDVDELGVKSDERVDSGTDIDQALDEREVTPTISLDHYYISDGNHRALALYVLGENEVRARVLSEDEVRERHRR